MDRRGFTLLRDRRGSGAINTHRRLVAVALALLIILVPALAAGCTSSQTTTTAGEVTSTQSAASVTTTAFSATSSTAPPSTEPETTTTTTTEPAVLVGELSGAGATFPQPAYVEWIDAFQQANPGVKMNYQGVGSGAGIQQFTDKMVDFGATDIPMTDEELAAAERASGAGVLQIPTLLGGLAIVYNLPGVEGLRLDVDTLAAIYLGDIIRWNDPRLAALNPGVKLPSTEIKTIHRSDSSMSTLLFTSYLSLRSPEWKSKVGSGKTVQWPVGVGGQGSEPPEAMVKQNEGAIAYGALAYVLQSPMQVADLKNAAGNFVRPSLASVTAAASGIQSEADLRSSLLDSTYPDAYPLVNATWILARDTMKDPAKAAILRRFLTWAFGEEGARIAGGLGYAPLPGGLKAAAVQQVKAIGSK